MRPIEETGLIFEGMRQVVWRVASACVLFAAAVGAFAIVNHDGRADETNELRAESSTTQELLRRIRRRVETYRDMADVDRQALLERIDTAKDAIERGDAVTAALSAMSVSYRDALRGAFDESPPVTGPLEAIARSDDPLLAADATFQLAKTWERLGDAEQAAPLFSAVVDGRHADNTLRGAEACVSLALAQAQLLDRDAAAKTLASLTERYPDAAPVIVESASYQAARIGAIVPDSLADVADRMSFSGRRLKLDRLDEKTSRQQETVVAMIDQMIKDAERQQRSAGKGGQSKQNKQNARRQQNKGQTAQRGNRQPTTGAQESTASAGKSEEGELAGVARSEPLESWGSLKEREREQVLTTLKGKFPDRYRRLIEQYYRSLQDER